jgi:hypothetical protein
MVRVKPIWSADGCTSILVYFVDGPVNQPLKRLMHMVNGGLQHRRPVICSDGQ